MLELESKNLDAQIWSGRLKFEYRLHSPGGGNACSELMHVLLHHNRACFDRLKRYWLVSQV